MTTTVRKWGNSLALRIPKSVAADTRLRSGSVVELAVSEGKMVVETVRRRKCRLDELVKAVTRRNLHSSVDTGDAVGREAMNTARYVYWQDGKMWIGYLDEFPDYMTQGRSLEELRRNLKDIYDDLTGGKVPGVRHVAELPIQ